METQEIIISPIHLRWSDWFEWEKFLLDARTNVNAVKVPDSPGIYEVKYTNQEIRLTIGKASSLRSRIKQGLIKGNISHSTGKRIRQVEDTTKIIIRWAETNRPSAVEEELHKIHIKTSAVYQNTQKEHDAVASCSWLSSSSTRISERSGMVATVRFCQTLSPAWRGRL